MTLSPKQKIIILSAGIIIIAAVVFGLIFWWGKQRVIDQKEAKIKEFVETAEPEVGFMRSTGVSEQERQRLAEMYLSDKSDSDGDGIADEDELKYRTFIGTEEEFNQIDFEKLTEKDLIGHPLFQNLDPNNPDTDGDGLTDGEEVFEYLTSPFNPDFDGDGISDGDEVHKYGTSPNNPDTDGDGLTDYEEIMTYKTDPLNPDTDGDGFGDGEEVSWGFNPAGEGKIEI